MKIALHFFLLCCSISLFYACSESTDKVSGSFVGEAQAITLADSMFAAIGGKSAWCDLQSLYIKAEHTEPPMTDPYLSEIWRSMDYFDVIIEQQNDSFHVRAEFNEGPGIVRYLDHRDTFRTLSEEQIGNWRHSNKHNVYVILHDLACDPGNYEAKMEREQLSFYKDSVLICRFGLDKELRPHLFFAPDQNDKLNGSRFTHWGTDKGLVHSAGGFPLDSSFMYQTQEWTPSNKALRESFDIGSDD